MEDTELARERWIVERPQFQQFVDLVAERCRQHLKCAGIWAEVGGRAKEVDSLVKKLIKKHRHTYDSIPDKAGVRVIVRYKDEIQPAIKAISKAMECLKIEDKAAGLPPEKFGYLSVHVDAQLPEGDPDLDRFPAGQFRVEVQVRTMAQHLWSEMSHDTFYKDELTEIPTQLKRRIYTLAGVVELADEEFTKVARSVPSSPEIEVLRSLERHFYKFVARRADPEISVSVIQALLPIYGQDAQTVSHHLDEFLELRADILRDIYAAHLESDTRSAYLFQPEALLVYDLLQDHRWDLRQAWDDRFPPRELDRLSTAFGVSYS
jgi:ppGpp synthetase/RelA/SpoT-type nucleotidyltranferase